jgi:hypothetical protein
MILQHPAWSIAPPLKQSPPRFVTPLATPSPTRRRGASSEGVGAPPALLTAVGWCPAARSWGFAAGGDSACRSAAQECSGGILRAAVLRPTKIDRGGGTGSVSSTKVDPGGGSGGAFGPQTTREAVADDLLHPVHTTHADHECHRGGDEALDEDRASSQGRQAREPAYSPPYTANEVLAKIRTPPQPAHAAGEVLKVGPEDRRSPGDDL